jgi:hypothetical protein
MEVRKADPSVGWGRAQFVHCALFMGPEKQNTTMQGMPGPLVAHVSGDPGVDPGFISSQRDTCGGGRD